MKKAPKVSTLKKKPILKLNNGGPVNYPATPQAGNYNNGYYKPPQTYQSQTYGNQGQQQGNYNTNQFPGQGLIGMGNNISSGMNMASGLGNQAADVGAGLLGASGANDMINNTANKYGEIDAKQAERAGMKTGAAAGLKAGAAIGLNPAALAATGGLSALAVPIGAGIGAIAGNRSGRKKAEESNKKNKAAYDEAETQRLADEAKAKKDAFYQNSLRTNLASEMSNRYAGYKDGGEIKKQKKWLSEYLDSPKYKERLSKEFPNGSDNELLERKKNLSEVKVEEVDKIGTKPGYTSGVYIKPGKIKIEKSYNSPGYETIPVHEFGHSIDEGGDRIPESTKKLISSNTSDPTGSGYYNKPSEFVNRLQSVRYLLGKKGLYDAGTQNFDSSTMKKIMSDKDILNNEHYKDIIKTLNGKTDSEKHKQLELMMNSIAMNDNSKPESLMADGGKVTRNGYADGGLIKGPGTAKSDSIKAKVKPGSFIVPAENKEEAKEIKTKILKAPPMKKANLNQSNGEEVRLSKGEYLFTPDETKELLSIGIDLNKLAPNARKDLDDHMNCGGKVMGYAGGGKVGSDIEPVLKKRKELELKQEKYFAANGKIDNELAKQIQQTHIQEDKIKKTQKQSGAIARSEFDKSQEAKKQQAIADVEKSRRSFNSSSKNKLRGEASSYYETELNKAKKRLETANKNLDSFTVDQIKSLKNDVASKENKLSKIKSSTNIAGQELKDALNMYEKDKGVKAPSAPPSKTTTPASTGRDSTGIDFMKGDKGNVTPEIPSTKGADVKIEPQAKSDKLGKKAPSAKTVTKSKTPPPKSSYKTSDGPFSRDWSAIDTAPPPTENVDLTVNETENLPLTSSAQKAANEFVAPTTPPDAKTDMGNVLSSGLRGIADYGLPAAQIYLGAKGLQQIGKRPVDRIDQDYLDSISTSRGVADRAYVDAGRANADAKYGYSAEELAALNMANNDATSAGRFAARNYSGGSAGNAFNMERTALNDSFGRGLQTRINDRNLRMDKQRYADNRTAYADSKQADVTALNQDKANRSRNLFGDTMNAFQQNQSSAAGLLGSGIDNAIGAGRYRDQIELEKQRVAKYNPQPKTT